jgi:hypothetical protein
VARRTAFLISGVDRRQELPFRRHVLALKGEGMIARRSGDKRRTVAAPARWLVEMRGDPPNEVLRLAVIRLDLANPLFMTL